MAETTETLILDIQFDSNQAIKDTTALRNEVIKLKDANKEIIKEGNGVTDTYTKNAAQIKLYNAEISTNERALTNLVKSNNSVKGSNDQLKAQLSILTAEYNKLGEGARDSTVGGQVLQKQIKDITDTLKGAEGEVGNFRRNVGDYEGAFTRAANSIEGMKARIAELQTTIQSADVGSDQFREAADEASNLQLSVDQALGKVNEFGEREPKNNVKKEFGDALITVGLLGQGFNALSEQFSDNEDAQEALTKATQGVSVALAFANIIKEKGAILDTIDIRRKAVQSAATVVLTGVTAAFGVTAAIAWTIATLGIAALIAGIALLVANFEKVSNAVKDFLGLSSEQERASIALQENYQAEADKLDFLIGLEERRGNRLQKVFDRQIKLAQAAGKDTQVLEDRAALAEQASIRRNIAEIERQLKLAQAAKKGADIQIDLKQKIQDAESDLLDSQNEIEARRLAKGKKATDDAIKNAEKQNDVNKAANEKRKSDNEKSAQDELKIAQALSASRIALVEDERAREILTIRNANEQRIAEITSNSSNAEALRLSIAEETEQAVLAIKAKYLKIEKDAQDKTIEDEKARTLERQKLELEAITKRQEQTILRFQFEQAQRQLNITNEEAALIKTTEGLFNLAEIERVTGATRQQIVQDYYDFFDERGELSFEQYLALQQEQVAVTRQANEEQTQAAMAFGDAVGSIFADSLTEQGLELKDFSRKFLILILDTLERAVIANIATAAAGALSSPESIATAGIAGAVKAALLTAAIKAATGLAKAKLSQPPQGFAEGVIGLHGAGTTTSDSIPAMLSLGESVITANGTNYAQQNYPGLLDFLNTPHKYAGGVVDFQGGAPSSGVGSDSSALLFEAISRIRPVVQVSDINKKQSDYTEVRVTGTLS